MARVSEFEAVVRGDGAPAASGPDREDSPAHAQEPRGSRLDEWFARRSPRVQAAQRWAAPALVLLAASGTRLWNLGHPHKLVFDETFYVKDAWTLWNLGYEARWPAEANAMFEAGQTEVFSTDASFVVHPPLGKWLIGLGMAAFGPDNPAGWRIAPAIAGILAVALVMLVAWLLWRQTTIASLAGGLMAIDGNAIVMSRVGLLDNFLMLFALLGFLFVLLDRGWSAERLRRARASTWGPAHDWGPAQWNRPWLIAAGAAFGAATAVKWNGLYFLAGFALYTLVVDALARRRAGIPFWFSGVVFKQAPVTFLLMIPVAAVVHLTAWSGWFATEGGYDRQWADAEGNAWTGPLAWVPAALQSWWHFQTSVYDYHVGETRPHGYQANPLTWLLLVRPTSMYYLSSSAGENGCTAQLCGESITGLANPFLWWGAVIAAGYLVYRLIRRREWQVGLVLMGLSAGYLPWLGYLHRTVYQFYTIAFEPYLVLALAAVLGIILGSRDDPSWRRLSGLRTVGVYLAFVIAASVFFWPLWTGMQLPYEVMRIHWWFPSWR